MEDDKGGYRQIDKSLSIYAFDDYLKDQTPRLPQLASVEQLTPKVLRVLGQNPGKLYAVAFPDIEPGRDSAADTAMQFTYQGTNTYNICGLEHFL
jgi:hypothetical protein